MVRHIYKKMMSCIALVMMLLGVVAETMPPLPEGAFTFAVIPDTQSYDGEGRTTKRGRAPGKGPTSNAKFDAIVDWLAANAEKENIRFVVHTGDIVDMNNDFQWRFASNAMARLDGKIPYAVVPGNHDMDRSGDTTLFQRYFPASRYEGNPWYAATFSGFTNSAGIFVSGGNANSICLFEYGADKFAIASLECNAPDPVLEWASKELAKHPERHVIVATHQDLGAVRSKDGRTFAKESEQAPKLSALGRMPWHKCHGKEGNSGESIWKKFTSKLKNAFLVVSGDQGMIKITRVDEKGEHGNTVYSLMQDTGCGYIRIFRFVPSENLIRAYTIDPRRGGELVHSCGVWRDDKWFNFTLPYPGRDNGAASAASIESKQEKAPVAAVDPIAARKVDWPKVGNARDFGGLPTRNGKIVRRGRLFRSGGLNDNAAYRQPGTRKVLPREQWKGPGASRVTAETRDYIVNVLGVKTDLDLRTEGETFMMTGSPLGEKVKWIHISSNEYDGIGKKNGRAAFAADFKVFLDEANYPIIFHCIAGADRTGSLACVLGGLLGVEEELLHRDWQYTWTGRSKPTAPPEQRWHRLMKLFDTYEGATLNERIEKYVLSCGFTAEDIEKFRNMMLENTK